MSKARGWCFTINNPVPSDESELEYAKLQCEYFIYGREVGESGTPHLQGYIRFKHARSLRGVKSLLTRAHLESQKGSCAQAISYCKKDGDWTEFGECPAATSGLTTKERWKWLIERAECGDMESIKDEEPGMYIRYFEKLRSLQRREPIILGNLEHEWWYGESGTGKSRELWRVYPLHFQKELNKWWCGYGGEDVVAIEEWSPKNECTASFLKIWADRYPFTAQIKGGSLQKIRPKKIIVLSNYTIDQCFPNVEDSGPIKRRFKVKHFPTMFRGQVDDWIDDLDTINSLLNLSQ